MLRVGDTAPEIRAKASNGTPYVLSEQGGLCTVVYFFPKAFTPACTLETKLFRDNFAELVLAGANVLGVSTDDHGTQCRFAQRLHTPFPLIADYDRSIAKAYGVLWPLFGLSRRVTFVLSRERRVLAIFHHELRVKRIRDQVLQFVHELRLKCRDLGA